MSQKETDQLNRMMFGAALNRAICTVAELGVADHIQAGEPRSAAYLAKATSCHERSLYQLEFRTLFKQAGFDLTSVLPTSTMVSVVEGKPIPTAFGQS